MVLAFFDSQGMVYINYVHRGDTVDAKYRTYIIRALRTFLKNLRKERPETAKGE